MITHKTLMKFCSTDPTRRQLREPFNHHGYTFATDGMVMIVVDLFAGYKTTDKPSPHSTRTILYDIDSRTDFQPYDGDMPKPTTSQCPHCKGSGKGKKKCTDCEGTGEHVCRCGDLHVCGYCDGSGFVGADTGGTCELCEGTGERLDYNPVKFMGAYVSDRLLHLVLTELPGPVEFSVKDPLGIIAFRFPGGKGGLMPMKAS